VEATLANGQRLDPGQLAVRVLKGELIEPLTIHPFCIVSLATGHPATSGEPRALRGRPPSGAYRAGPRGTRRAMAAQEMTVVVPSAGVELVADVCMADHPHGVVLFAHGSGSSRRSPRNRFVAAALRDGDLATVLVDLLTPEEERRDAATAEHRFDIRLLATRLAAIVDWLATTEPVARHPVGLFGASTGAAAALVTAAARPEQVRAVVSRGGRSDLAGTALSHVRQPTLLLVGERDPAVVDMNRSARASLAGPASLEVIAGATHLFEEPGALEQVAHRARDWFVTHLSRASDEIAADKGHSP
jgi:putative phosphoribosyl transferase